MSNECYHVHKTSILALTNALNATIWGKGLVYNTSYSLRVLVFAQSLLSRQDCVSLKISRNKPTPNLRFLRPCNFLFFRLCLKQRIPAVMRMRNPHPTGTAMVRMRPIKLVICTVFSNLSAASLSPKSFQADTLKAYSVLHLSEGRSTEVTFTVTLI